MTLPDKSTIDTLCNLVLIWVCITQNILWKRDRMWLLEYQKAVARALPVLDGLAKQKLKELAEYEKTRASVPGNTPEPQAHVGARAKGDNSRHGS